MKKIFLTVFIILLYIIGFSQNNVIVCGKFASHLKFKVKIYEPINGYYNMSFYSTCNPNNYIVNNLDSFYFKSRIDSAVTIRCYITNDKDIFITKSEIVLFPKDSVHLNIDLDKDIKESITYTGSNAAGQKLFNDINYDPLLKYQKVIDRLSVLHADNKDSFTKDIDSYVQNWVMKFDILNTENKISKGFYDYMKVAFAQLLYDIVIEKLLGAYKRKEVFTKKERDNIISDFYSKHPISNNYSKSIFNSYFYIIQYYNFLAYKKLNLESIEPLKESGYHLIDGSQIRIGNFCSQFVYIDNKKIQEDLWANYLLLMLPAGTPEPIEESITQFKNIFPKSKWNSIIAKLYTDINQNRTIEYSLQSPVRYIDSSKNINTLNSLLAELPENKAVFVDLWASWCGPCITAFQFNKQLDTFLLNNNIERLYLSIDSKGNEQIWRKTIDRYALGGYHIIASQNLLKEIRQLYLIPEHGPISIPRYILISKSKKILKAELISPVNTDELKVEITNLLLAN